MAKKRVSVSIGRLISGIITHGRAKLVAQFLGLLILLAIMIFAGINLPAVSRAYLAGRDLHALHQEMHGWPTMAQRKRMQTDVDRLDDATATLFRSLQPLFPLLSHSEWMPKIGPTLTALPATLSAGRESLHAGRLLVDIFVPVLPALRPQSMMEALPPLLTQVQAHPTALTQAEEALNSAISQLAAVNADRLPTRFATSVKLAQRWLPVGSNSVAFLRLAPTLLGSDQERVWLILAQNNEELRPTGGFISGVGIMRVQQGNISKINFVDSYAFQSPKVNHPLPPSSLRHAMKAELFFLRDANWWPDGPTSAQVVARFYKLETGTDVDGVVMLDLNAVQLLVDGLGPLTLADGTVVSAHNIIPYFYHAWANPTTQKGSQVSTSKWWSRRKNFMHWVMQAALNRVQKQSNTIALPRLARDLVQAVNERHLLLVALHSPNAQQIIAEQGWDGALRPGDGDYLRVTDSNVGFNKANAKVRTKVAYEVDLRQNLPLATLTMSYTHTSRVHITHCIQKAYYGKTYEDMQDRCYWDYLRVDVPAGAHLLAATGFQPEKVISGVGDAGTTEFAGLFVIAPGETRSVTIRYALPKMVVRNNVYALRIQKQPGTNNTPFALRIHAPNNILATNLKLSTDMDLHLRLDTSVWRIAPTYPLPRISTHLTKPTQ